MDEDVETEIDAVRAEVAGLRSDLAREVRSARVVVVDESGVERVVLSARNRAGSVLVCVDGPSDRTTGVELVAAEDPDGGEPTVGLFELRHGDAVE